jgi:hypothetical protein
VEMVHSVLEGFWSGSPRILNLVWNSSLKLRDDGCCKIDYVRCDVVDLTVVYSICDLQAVYTTMLPDSYELQLQNSAKLNIWEVVSEIKYG